MAIFFALRGSGVEIQQSDVPFFPLGENAKISLGLGFFLIEPFCMKKIWQPTSTHPLRFVVMNLQKINKQQTAAADFIFPSTKNNLQFLEIDSLPQKKTNWIWVM